MPYGRTSADVNTSPTSVQGCPPREPRSKTVNLQRIPKWLTSCTWSTPNIQDSSQARNDNSFPVLAIATNTQFALKRRGQHVDAAAAEVSDVDFAVDTLAK